MDGGIGVVMTFRSFIAAIAVLFFFGGTAPVFAGERFIDNGDGTVTDTELNVMWATSDNQVDISYKDASRWTRFTFGYTISGSYDDWRLPRDGELKSLFTAGKKNNPVTTDCGMIASIIPQIQLSCAWVWATHKVTGEPVIFNFDYGARYGSPDEITGCRALPVRSIPKS